MTALPYPLRTRRDRHRRSSPGFMSFVAIALAAWPVAAQGPREEDRARLVQLYRETDGANWRNNRNWDTDEPTSRWYGLSTFVPTQTNPTTATERHVTAIELRRNNLSGDLGLVDFAGMRYLARVDLFRNALVGAVPRFRTRPIAPAPPFTQDIPPHLDYLDLSDNILSLPSGGALVMPLSLSHLDLSHNDLSGYVSQLVSRPPPHDRDAPGDLAYLDLSFNALTGLSPDALRNLPNLQWLDLSYNFNMDGPIPPELGSLANLRFLSLVDSGFNGPIPRELGNLVNLERLRLGNNPLTGPIPSELGKLSNLEQLWLDSSGLSGPIPPELGGLRNLELLSLDNNGLSGSIPPELGGLANLEVLSVANNALTGPVPPELGSLSNLRSLSLYDNWGLSGALPEGLRRSQQLRRLGLYMSRACAPPAWREWLATIEFDGLLCWEPGASVTIDLAVFYTPAARAAAGGAGEIAGVIDLMIAETNQAYEASGVGHRLALVERSELAYAETGVSSRDVGRLADPSDGHMDEVHPMRDRVGADLVHLIVSGDYDFAGQAEIFGAFGITHRRGGGFVLAHELGHNMGLLHDRYERSVVLSRHPGYGYVNQRGLASGGSTASRWRTLMAYPDQCAQANVHCPSLFRFSNPRQHYNGEPMGIPFGAGGPGSTGAADAVTVLNATGPTVALWRDRPPGANQPPMAAGVLSDRELTVHGTLETDVSTGFVDPDGEALSYRVSSSAPHVVTVLASAARLTLTAVGEGVSVIRVTATDPGGLSATQSFRVTVTPPSNVPPVPVGTLEPLTIELDDDAVTVDVSDAFRDPDGDRLDYAATSSAPTVAGVSMSASTVTVNPVGTGTATVRVTATDAGGTNRSATQSFTVTVVALFTDHPLVPGETPVRAVHFTELRSRIDRLRLRAGLPAYGWTEPVLTAGVTPVRLAHLLELRSALAAAYAAAGRASPSWTDAAVGQATPIRAVHLMELRAAVMALE